MIVPIVKKALLVYTLLIYDPVRSYTCYMTNGGWIISNKYFDILLLKLLTGIWRFPTSNGMNTIILFYIIELIYINFNWNMLKYFIFY